MAYGIEYVSPVDITPTWVTEDQWFTADVSAYVPAGALAAVLDLGCPAVESTIGWRKPGSTDNHTMSQEDRSHVLAIVGLDSNREFELWLDNDDFEVFIVGYIPAGAGEIETNWIDKSTATTVTWVEIDLSSNITGGVGAAAIMRVKNTDSATYDGGVRSTDSSDEEFYRSWRGNTAMSLLTGLDSSEKCEQKIENVLVDVWYCGAIYSGYISMQNTPTDYSTTTRGSWVDTALSAMAAGSKMAVILGHATGAERSLKVRRDGDTWDFSAAVYGDMIYTLYMVVGTDSAKEIEQWCEDLANYPELFLIGEVLDGGGVSLLMNALSGALSAETSTVSPGAVQLAMDALSGATSAQGITLSPGVVQVLVNALSGSLSAEQMQVQIAGMILMQALSLASSAEAFTVSPGSIAVVLNALSGTLSAEQIAALPGEVQLVMDALLGMVSAEPLSITPGAVQIALDVLTGVLTTDQLQVIIITRILMQALSLAGSAQALAVSPGEVQIAMDALTGATSVEAVSLALGEVVVVLNALTGNFSPQQFALLASATIAVDALTVTSTAATLTLSPGAVQLLMQALSGSLSAQALTAFIRAAEHAAERTIEVSAENRVIKVGAEDRTITVDLENRVMTIVEGDN